MIIGLLKKPDGSVAAVYFNVNFTGDRLAHLHQIKEEGDEVALVDSDIVSFPDYSFRDAWTHDLTIDMQKARLIHLDRLRLERNEKLTASDIEYMKAMESGDMLRINAIKLKRQLLRDMPTNIASDLENIDNPADLKNFRPAILDEVL